jgi:Na+/H+ antiporter NhaC
MRLIHGKHSAIGELWVRPLAPQETDFEMIFLAVTLMTATCAFSWLAFGLPWPKCWFRQLTGFPCPTCGATRTAMALSHGHLVAAWQQNPFMFLCYAATILIDLYAAAVLAFRLPRLRVSGLPSEIKHRLMVASSVALAINWCYLLLNR